MGASVGTGRWEFATLRRALAIALVAVGLLAVGAGPAAAAGEGDVHFQRTAGGSIDHRLISSPTLAEKTFWQQKYWRVRGFSPYYDQALGWAPESHFYQDLYAIYRNDTRDQQLLADHPDWALRDANGNRLYIPWGCSNGVCPQYAADIGNPEFRAYWIEHARKIMAKGYSGIFVDDVNLEMSVGDGSGQRVAPMDPRTGKPMTDADWRRYMAEFTEEIRAAFPDKEIVHNSLWWMDHNDPYVQRQTAAADYIEMERGFADGGIGGGTGRWSYNAYLAHVDWLHQQGVGVFFEPYDLTAQSALFELASYLLVSNGNDAIASEYKADPSNWWSGWETDLGDATGARYSWEGLRRRDFSGGMVLTNEPGAPTRTVQLPQGNWKDLSGNPVSSVTLGPRQGAVVTGESTASDGSGDGTAGGTATGTTGSGTTGSSGSTTTTQPTTSTTTSGSTSGSTATAPPSPASGSQTEPTTTSTSSSKPAPTIKVNRKKVRRGRSVTVTGQAASPRVEIRAYIDGAWQVVTTDDTVENGTYGAKLRTTAPGKVELKATAPGYGESGSVTIRVK